ncbi:hypothetical protein UMZ34_20690 [Halopseudomonas pachastrellae]|nr:hypothetical protein UMZ34_20690 [Halopseudomonas pachastrellae]
MVTAPLGQWVTVGGLDDATSGRDSDVGRRISTQRSDSGSIRLKVDRVD